MKDDEIEMRSLISSPDVEAPASSSLDLEDDENNGNDEGDDLVVVVENVHKTYLLGAEGVAALRGVSLQVKRGELLMLYGTSGGGKTTLLNCIGTIDKPTKGFIKVSNLRINNKTTDTDLAILRLKKIGFVFQSFNLISSLSAIENVEMPMVLMGNLTAAERTRRAKELLGKVGMGHRLHHVPSQLSGGEQQRVTIARALANKPELLLLDEPTGDLDTKNTEIVLKMLLELNQDEKITMVMVTHDMSLKLLADRVVHLRDGRLYREEITALDRKEQSRAAIIAAGTAHTAAMGLKASQSDGDSASSNHPISMAACTSTELRQPNDYAMLA